MRYDIANTLPVLEQIRDELQEALSPATQTAVSAIEARIQAAEKHVKQMQASLDKYKRNPQKYKPQLDNLRQAAKGLYQIGRVVMGMNLGEARKFGELPRVSHAEIEKNTFPGRSPWLMTLYMDDGTKQTSWYRTQALAKQKAQSLHGLKPDKIKVKK